MLAILNMMMMGDGSSNILNKNSLTDFNAEYGFIKKDVQVILLKQNICL